MSEQAFLPEQGTADSTEDSTEDSSSFEADLFADEPSTDANADDASLPGDETAPPSGSTNQPSSTPADPASEDILQVDPSTLDEAVRPWVERAQQRARYFQGEYTRARQAELAARQQLQTQAQAPPPAAAPELPQTEANGDPLAPYLSAIPDQETRDGLTTVGQVAQLYTQGMEERLTQAFEAKLQALSEQVQPALAAGQQFSQARQAEVDRAFDGHKAELLSAYPVEKVAPFAEAIDRLYGTRNPATGAAYTHKTAYELLSGQTATAAANLANKAQGVKAQAQAKARNGAPSGALPAAGPQTRAQAIAALDNL